MENAEKSDIVFVRAWTGGRMMYKLMYSSTGGTGFGSESLMRQEVTEQEMRDRIAAAHPGVAAHVHAPGGPDTAAMVAVLEVECQTVRSMQRAGALRRCLVWANADLDMRRTRGSLVAIPGVHYRLTHLTGNLWDLATVVGSVDRLPVRVVVAVPPDTVTATRWVLRTDGDGAPFTDADGNGSA